MRSSREVESSTLEHQNVPFGLWEHEHQIRLLLRRPIKESTKVDQNTFSGKLYFAEKSCIFHWIIQAGRDLRSCETRPGCSGLSSWTPQGQILLRLLRRLSLCLVASHCQRPPRTWPEPLCFQPTPGQTCVWPCPALQGLAAPAHLPRQGRL